MTVRVFLVPCFQRIDPFHLRSNIFLYGVWVFSNAPRLPARFYHALLAVAQNGRHLVRVLRRHERNDGLQLLLGDARHLVVIGVKPLLLARLVKVLQLRIRDKAYRGLARRPRFAVLKHKDLVRGGLLVARGAQPLLIRVVAPAVLIARAKVTVLSVAVAAVG